MKSYIGIDGYQAANNQQQRDLLDKITSGPRGSVPTPFFAMLDAPNLTDAIQAVGEVIRYQSVLADELRETAILTVASVVGCAYEWNYHAPLAQNCGVPVTVINATLSEAISVSDESFSLVIQLCRQAVKDNVVQAEIIKRSNKLFGRQSTTELIAIAGYYALLATFIKTAGRDSIMPVEYKVPQ